MTRKVVIVDLATGTKSVTVTPDNELLTSDIISSNLRAGEIFISSNTISLGSGVNVEYLINVPANTKIFGRIGFSSRSAVGFITLFTGTTTTADGSVQAIRNKDTTSSNTTGVIVTRDPTGVVQGTLIAAADVPIGKGLTFFGGGPIDVGLGAGKHLLRFTNDDAVSSTVGYNIFFYSLVV